MRLGLLSVTVKDQARALAFYTEKLGFELKRDDPAGEFRAITLVEPGRDDVALLLEPDAHPASKVFQEAIRADGLPAAIFFVKDLEAEHRRLTALGVRFAVEPQRSEWGHQAVLDDTCGNLIALFEEEE